MDALVAVALRGVPESSEAWEAIYALRRRGGEKVFAAASALLRSPLPRERARGADILAQLEQPPDLRSRAADLMLPLLSREKDAQVLESLILGLGHLEDSRVTGVITPLRDHPSARVRGAVLLNILKSPGEELLPVLLAFADDPDEGVRGLVMAHLRTLPPEVDTPGLRDVLVRRMDDVSPMIRAEAVLLLAYRKDPRILDPLRRVLRRSRVREEFVEAAGALGDPSLLPALRALEGQRQDDRPFTRALATAIAALEAVA
ncbi:HEAT repeat domain-containing protein [Corallococcus aberystwythensis]|uniref:HEAT repeat domain-containing protein n=1 Tax=Corallococcus aberystwythensis TaxID=2316722 RepID=UPI0011C34F6A|nr:HEAT repeat domain-containing protein [Corallococcus aberystwythensis]